VNYGELKMKADAEQSEVFQAAVAAAKAAPEGVSSCSVRRCSASLTLLPCPCRHHTKLHQHVPHTLHVAASLCSHHHHSADHRPRQPNSTHHI
jgi:hypothetical protein